MSNRRLWEGDELTQTTQETFDRRSVRRTQGNIRHCFGLRCSAASQNNVLRFVVMTICLCHGGICELCIHCSWPRVNMTYIQIKVHATYAKKQT